MATSGSGRRRATGRRGGGLRSLTRVAARGGGVAGGRGVDGRIRLLRFVFIVFLVLVGGKAVALASSSANLTRIALEQQTDATVDAAPAGDSSAARGDPSQRAQAAAAPAGRATPP